MTCLPLVVPADPTADPGVLDRLREAAGGVGPLLLPQAPGDEAALPAGEIDEEVVPAGGGTAVGTSGSTGAAKRAVLTAEALAASADATHARLGGPGRWLLALPPHHIAGLQILLRSLRAGHTPAVVPPGSFTADAFTAGVRSMPDDARRYSSLVPTQLARVLASPSAVDAARTLDGLRVGGSATSPTLVDRAREAGIPLVLTYGMSETAGGCVYDGIPLDGVRVRFDDGRIHLAGPMLATGYLVRPDDSPFVVHEGTHWFRTDDIGRLDDGRLVIDGRVDDVIISGGLKVWPSEVERALAPALPAGCDLAVIGLPDPEWGQRVALVVESPTGDDVLAPVLARADASLPRHARPRLTRVVTSMPRRGPGKPDRAGLAALFTEAGWDDGRTPREG